MRITDDTMTAGIHIIYQLNIVQVTQRGVNLYHQLPTGVVVYFITYSKT